MSEKPACNCPVRSGAHDHDCPVHWFERHQHLSQQLEQGQARMVELLTVCQVVQRDLLLRAEPDWDGSGRKVVNLSAGFWGELNRVIGKYDESACKSFDAEILRKQAEAVEAITRDLRSDTPAGKSAGRMITSLVLRSEYLRQQADELEKK